MVHKAFVVLALAGGLWVVSKTTNVGSYAGTLWSKARAETKRRMQKIYAEYEARQVRFDAREHRRGGPVERLIDRLVED